MLPTVPIPGLEPAHKAGEVLRTETYTNSLTHLSPSERQTAADLLNSFESNPSITADQMVTVLGQGTGLIRFHGGLFVIYQHRIVADEHGRTARRQFTALFCWRTQTVDGQERITIPDWAGA